MTAPSSERRSWVILLPHEGLPKLVGPYPDEKAVIAEWRFSQMSLGSGQSSWKMLRLTDSEAGVWPVEPLPPGSVVE